MSTHSIANTLKTLVDYDKYAAFIVYTSSSSPLHSTSSIITSENYYLTCFNAHLLT